MGMNAFTNMLLISLFMFFFLVSYRGPSSNNYDSYTLKYNGQSQPPSQRPTNFVSNGYYNPYLDKHGFYGALNTKDRVSIGGGKLFFDYKVAFFVCQPNA